VERTVVVIGCSEFALSALQTNVTLGFPFSPVSFGFPGNTLHGFTNPAADGTMMRTAVYSAQADRRSWASMRGLFEQVFGEA
jgi:hypothetical protein